jgi:light-regulated signal transduction histidine kinase (bacteriophytochrome)
MMDVYPGIDATQMFEVLRRCMAGAPPARLINEFVHEDGSSAWFELFVEPVPEGLFILSLDVTAQQQAQDALRRLNAELERRVQERTRDLEQANQELEAFSYSVSHDLRAPLRHIDGFVELLTRHAAGSLDEQGARYLSVISGAARRMGTLIDDLLGFSRVGRVELRAAPVSLEQLAREAIVGVGHAADGRTIVWQLDALPEVVADAATLRLVFQNLIGNAVKYTRPRSEARIQVGATSREREVVFFVRDNGVGFDARHADKLFGVFERLHPADAFEGTGIGLANVRRIIERHGGRTWAEGEVDRGATFYCSLPKTREARAAPPDAPETRS